MLDVDHFKSYNDEHGHLEGDACLRSVAAGLQACLQRGSDLLARYGGEEFAVLLPEADAALAQAMGERLRARVAQLASGLRPYRQGRAVSISVGVATLWPGDGAAGGRLDEQLAGLVRRADEALYAAKAQGRDRVVVGGDGEQL